MLVRTTLVDPGLAVGVAELLALPGGSRLFRFPRRRRVRNLTGSCSTTTSREYLGGGFTAKDFRTWGGSLTAAVALAEHGPAASETEAKRAIAAAMRRVGEQLGNTPAVARASYVSPAVLEQFREGRTLEHFRPAASGHSRAGRRASTSRRQSLLDAASFVARPEQLAAAARGGSAAEEREVGADHVHRDVPDRHLADRALGRAVVGVAVEDEVGSVGADRLGEAARAEEGPDPLRLADERFRDGRVVEEHDPAVTARDRLEPLSRARPPRRPSRGRPGAGATRRSR